MWKRGDEKKIGIYAGQTATTSWNRLDFFRREIGYDAGAQHVGRFELTVWRSRRALTGDPITR